MPKRRQVSTSIGSETHLILKWPISHKYYFPFKLKDRGHDCWVKALLKMSLEASSRTTSQKNRLGTDFNQIFWWIWLPCWGSRWSQEGFKIDVKIEQFLRSSSEGIGRRQVVLLGEAARHVNGGAEFWGVLIVSLSRHPSSDPRHLRGIQQEGSRLNPHTHTVVQAHGGG